jgi:flagellar capping protein FliD
MLIEGLRSVIASTTSMPISDWGVRLAAPLGFSPMSKNGMIELAGRVYWIFPLMIAAVVIAIKYGYLTGRATSPDLSSTNPTGVLTKDTADDSPTSSSDIGDDLERVDAALTNPEDYSEDSIEDFSTMDGIITDDDEAFVDEPHERILQQQTEQIEWMEQQHRERREEIEQLRNQEEQLRDRIDRLEQQVQRQVEQLWQQMQQMAQRIDQLIERNEWKPREKSPLLDCQNTSAHPRSKTRSL